MSITFRQAVAVGLEGLTCEAPDGAIVGVIGEESAGLHSLLRLAGGLDTPSSGEATASEPRRTLGPADALNLAPAGTLVLEHTLSRHDALVRARAVMGLERLRRDGATILLLSHEQDLLRQLSDEVWWMHQGRLMAHGDPREVLDAYNRHVAEQVRVWAAQVKQPLSPSMRRGDGRASILALETLDGQGRPAVVWRSGDEVAVRVRVRFKELVQDPVVGIMIRTRIGFEVFGTNTELEHVKLGPAMAGETLSVTFAFQCGLCAQEYTLTAASHDPNGVWHDWLEDAVAFSVTDVRYTAGVANLRARVGVERG
ncbi:MAG: Wzt carbohydrate-binding domain-containing protein [Acidobacteriia bacterium]|nr:Wzt carbohydrate-binding domain-containing protein [Terriglobia bacterium]